MILRATHFHGKMNGNLLLIYGRFEVIALQVTAGLFCVYSPDARWTGPGDPMLTFESVGPGIYNPAAIARIEADMLRNGLSP